MNANIVYVAMKEFKFIHFNFILMALFRSDESWRKSRRDGYTGGR